MSTLRVAIVSRNSRLRFEAARAFDAAPTSWLVRVYEDVPAGADVVVFGDDVARGDGIVFDPVHPEKMLEEIASSAGRARVLVVTGGGRGVGVTTVGLHLASTSAADQSTCFVDLDPSGGAMHRLGIGEAVDSEDRSDDLERAAVPVPGGFRVLNAHSVRHVPIELIESITHVYGRLIVDAPDGPESADVLERADAGVLVMTPSPSSVQRAAMILEANQETRWAIVLNRIGPGGDMARHHLERSLGRRIGLELPCTPALRDCEERCTLLSSTVLRWPRRLHRLYRVLERA